MLTTAPLLAQARQYFRNQEYSRAYAVYEQLIHEYPEDPYVFRQYGSAIYAQFDDLEKATHLFERELELDPESENGWLYLASLYSMGYGKGYDAALPMYQRLIKVATTHREQGVAYKPDSLSNAYIGIGMLQHVPGSPISYEDALSAFRTAIELDPLRADAYQNLGFKLLEKGEKQEAREVFQLAEQLFRKKGQSTEIIDRMIKAIDSDEAVALRQYINYSSQLDWPVEQELVITDKTHH